MKRNVKELDVSFALQKNFLLNVCHYDKIKDVIYLCMNTQELKQVIQCYPFLLDMSIEALYDVKSYQEMEDVIQVMDILFPNQSYEQIKDQLLQKLLHRHISVDIYCVIRHMMLKKMNMSTMMTWLYNHGCQALDCAKFCLIEDQYELALYYLRMLDDCDDEVVLDLVRGYRFFEYQNLRKYYRRKKQMKLTLA